MKEAEQGKRQKAKGKRQKFPALSPGGNAIFSTASDGAYAGRQRLRFIFAFCLLPFAFCLALAQTSVPMLYWTGELATAETLKQAGVTQLAVPAGKLAAWRAAGFDAVAVSESEFAQREKLLPPRLAGRGANVASATRRPWIDANGWRFVRNPTGKFAYDLSDALPGKGALAAAEAYAYRADVVIKVEASELPQLGEMLRFLRGLPAGLHSAAQTNVADIGVIDDGSPELGEVMNLLTRRNLLFQTMRAPSKAKRVNIELGSAAYPRNVADDPSAFALRVRRELGDEQRSLRVYGAEIVICRLTSDGKRAWLHLLNYSGREVDSLRLSLRGDYDVRAIHAVGVPAQTATEITTAHGVTEFSLPRLLAYGVVELTRR